MPGLGSQGFTFNSAKRKAANFYVWNSEDPAKPPVRVFKTSAETPGGDQSVTTCRQPHLRSQQDPLARPDLSSRSRRMSPTQRM